MMGQGRSWLEPALRPTGAVLAMGQTLQVPARYGSVPGTLQPAACRQVEGGDRPPSRHSPGPPDTHIHTPTKPNNTHPLLHRRGPGTYRPTCRRSSHTAGTATPFHQQAPPSGGQTRVAPKTRMLLNIRRTNASMYSRLCIQGQSALLPRAEAPLRSGGAEARTHRS